MKKITLLAGSCGGLDQILKIARPTILRDISHPYGDSLPTSAQVRCYALLKKKCELKGVFMPTLESIQNALTKGELISEWENMLRHQLQALPPLAVSANAEKELFSEK